MRILFLFILLCIACQIPVWAQKSGKPFRQYYIDPSKPETWVRTVVREIDLEEPANCGLDSILSANGEPLPFRELIFDKITAGRINGYKRVDSPAAFKVMDYHDAKDVINGLSDTVFKKIFLQEQWTYDEKIRRMTVRIEMLAPGVQNDQKDLSSAIWVAYPNVRSYFSNYYLYDVKGTRRSLSDFFEARWFRSKILFTEKQRIR